jgi:hypothetical protein
METVTSLNSPFESITSLSTVLNNDRSDFMEKEVKFKGQAAIGKRVQVFWDLENRYFKGVVVQYNQIKGDYRIRYDDGKTMWGHILKDLEFIEIFSEPSIRKRRISAFKMNSEISLSEVQTKKLKISPKNSEKIRSLTKERVKKELLSHKKMIEIQIEELKKKVEKLKDHEVIDNI